MSQVQTHFVHVSRKDNISTLNVHLNHEHGEFFKIAVNV